MLSSIVELGYMCPRRLSGPTAVTLTKWLKYNKRLLLRDFNFSVLIFVEIVILRIYYIIPFGFSLFRHLLDITF